LAAAVKLWRRATSAKVRNWRSVTFLIPVPPALSKENLMARPTISE
jgi:hypothetical protein